MTALETQQVQETPPRNQHGKFLRTPEQMEKDHHAAMLRSKGWTYKRISEELGMSLPAVYVMVKRAIADIPKESTEELIQIELAKLDVVEAKAAEIMEKHHAYVSASGKVATLDGEILQDDAPAMQAMMVILKVSDRRAKLLGINAPTRTELTGKDGGAIEIDDRSGEAKAKVLSLLGRLAEAG